MSHLPIPSKGKSYDLNIPYNPSGRNIEAVLSTLKELGYDVFALSNFIPSGFLKKVSNQQKVAVPSPPTIKNETSLSMTQLTRITVELKEIKDQIALRDPTVSEYDLIAVQPKTEKLFHAACTKLDVDIISIDGNEKQMFYFKTNVVRVAIARGIHFELNYAPMIHDSTSRRLTITNALRMVECCNGKHIILSSNAKNALDLRGPYDVASLGLLFGIKENIVPHVVSANCRAVIVSGFARKTAKCTIHIEKLAPSSPKAKKRPCEDEEENEPNVKVRKTL